MRDKLKKVLAIGGSAVFLSAGIMGCTQTLPTLETTTTTIVETEQITDAGTPIVNTEPTEVTEPIVTETITEEVESSDLFKYWDNEYEYGESICVRLDESKIEKLIDDKIEFDNDDIEVEEFIEICGTKVGVSADNDKNFDDEPHLMVDNNKVKLGIKFKDDLVADDIDDDEPLELMLSGQKVKIIKVTTGSITFDAGVTKTLQEGESLVIDGKTVTLTAVSDSSESIIVDVNGVSDIIEEGRQEEVNDIEIKCEIVTSGAAKISAGMELTTKISVGDPVTVLGEEDDDKDANWVLGAPVIEGGDLKEISIENNKDMQKLSKGALEVGEYLALPNDYLRIVFDSIADNDPVKMSIDCEDIDDYECKITLDGSEFNFDNDEFETVYTDGTDVFDDDENLINSKVFIGDSDYEIDGSLKIIKNGVVKLDVLNNAYDRYDFVLTQEGFILDNTEEWAEDQEQIDITIPQDDVEITLGIRG